MAWDIGWDISDIVELATTEEGRRVLEAKNVLDYLHKRVRENIDEYIVDATSAYGMLRTKAETVPMQVLDYAGQWISQKISDQIGLIDAAIGRASTNFRYLADKASSVTDSSSASEKVSHPCNPEAISREEYLAGVEAILRQPGVAGMLWELPSPYAMGCCQIYSFGVAIDRPDREIVVPKGFSKLDTGLSSRPDAPYYQNFNAHVYFTSGECVRPMGDTGTLPRPSEHVPSSGTLTYTPPQPSTSTTPEIFRPQVPFPVPQIPFPQPAIPAPQIPVPQLQPQIPPMQPVMPIPEAPQPVGPMPTMPSVNVSCPPPTVQVQVQCPTTETEKKKEETSKQDKEAVPCEELYYEANKHVPKPEYQVTSLPQKNEDLCWEIAPVGGDEWRSLVMACSILGLKVQDAARTRYR